MLGKVDTPVCAGATPQAILSYRQDHIYNIKIDGESVFQDRIEYFNLDGTVSQFVKDLYMSLILDPIISTPTDNQTGNQTNDGTEPQEPEPPELPQLRAGKLVFNNISNVAKKIEVEVMPATFGNQPIPIDSYFYDIEQENKSIQYLERVSTLNEPRFTKTHFCLSKPSLVIGCANASHIAEFDAVGSSFSESFYSIVINGELHTAWGIMDNGYDSALKVLSEREGIRNFLRIDAAGFEMADGDKYPKKIGFTNLSEQQLKIILFPNIDTGIGMSADTTSNQSIKTIQSQNFSISAPMYEFCLSPAS